jgi:hypothetical protein
MRSVQHHKLLAAWLMFMSGVLLSGQDLKFPVRHDHVRNGGEGTLTFSRDGVAFEETAGNPGHSRQWKYADLERVELSPDRIRLATYQDVRWQVTRDRDYVFDRLPQDMAAQLYAYLSGRLDQRFVARLADTSVAPLWATDVKVVRGRNGATGKLKIGADRVVFESPMSGDSRTWRYLDIQLVSREDAFHLSITSIDGQVRFQLKEAFPEERYNWLWRRVAQFSGARPVHSLVEIHHN